MSDYLAVGGVSAVLKSLLTDALTMGGPSSILGASAGITNKAPDLIVTGPDETAQINIFMYYASINTALRNVGLPSMSAGGTKLSNPPLALNLHYLVTAYGAHQFDPEILLAWAMQVFHNNPVVPRVVIEQALLDLVATLPVSQEQTLVSGSTLAGQIEHIRIAPEALTTEEIYRLWTAFNSNYRPTTSYQVSVVIIQDTQSYKSNLPVRSRSILALPLMSPVIDAINPPMAASGQQITIVGRNFIGDNAIDTLVSFDGGPGVVAAAVQGTVLRVNIPATLMAGVRSVRVLRNVVFPSSAKTHSGFSSNPVPLQLLPVIQLPATPPIKAKLGTPLTLTLKPAVGSMQTVTIHFGDQAVPVPSRPVSGPSSSATVTVSVPTTIPMGTYPLRIEVDAAQSRLTLDTNVVSPTYNQWLPQVEVSA